MDTVNFTLRLPPSLAAAADVRAAQSGISRHQLIIDLLDDELHQSQLIVGRWKVRYSEFEECADCGQPLEDGDTWIGATADGRMFGPICRTCARAPAHLQHYAPYG